MDFEFINPLNFPGWDDLVLTAEDYSFFHCSAWIRVLRESYGYNPLFFAIPGQAKPSAVIPLLEVDSFLTGRRAVSLPFSDYCEPLVFDQGPLQGIPGSLIEAAKKAGWKHLELRGQSLFGPEVQVWERFVCHRLKLSNPQGLSKKLHTNTVRNLKRAKASGLEVEDSGSFEAIREYYGLHCLTRKRQAVPPQPFSFFRKIHEHICSKGKGRVILARHRGKAVAGAVYFHFGRKAMYKFGASDMGFSKLGANAAVMWEAISRYADEGYDSFCFGRTDPRNLGLIRFKAGWGAREEPLCYYRYDLKKSAFVEGTSGMGDRAEQLLLRLPLPLLRLVGQLLYKHVG